jgi:hypothetical protein
MAQPTVAPKDILLTVSLGFLLYDLICDWQAFGLCPKPIHKWLAVSYATIVGWRLTTVIASLLSSTKTVEVLLNLRHEDVTPRIMVSATWLLVPFVAVWSLLGSAWTWGVMTSAPDCMPSRLHLAFLGVWQVLCYAWLGTNVFVGKTAWVMESRVRQAEQDLREIEDDDSLRRWGHVSMLSGYSGVPAKMACDGMTPAEIRSLPGIRRHTQEEASEVGMDCAICLHPLQAGETVRELSACRHEFHKSCIDLWLLRSGDCPMCKTKVSAGSAL